MTKAGDSLAGTVTQTLEDTYNDVPYEGQSFPQSHPDRLATLARLRGIAAAPITSARVLEIGCGPAGNLAPMAESLPGARFVGIDIAKRHVELGTERVAAAGIGNVELRHADLTEVGDSLGTFDYVIAHGVYSWVPPQVADHLLALVARSLSPNGVAYVSYNTLPGWYGRGVIRDLMRFHADAESAMAPRVTRGREALNWLKETLPDGGRYAQPLVQDIANITKDTDWYLAHELMCEDNHPVYFSELVSRICGDWRCIGKNSILTHYKPIQTPTIATSLPSFADSKMLVISQLSPVQRPTPTFHCWEATLASKRRSRSDAAPMKITFIALQKVSGSRNAVIALLGTGSLHEN